MPDSDNSECNDVFISYSRSDVTTVVPDVKWLRSKGHSVWFDGDVHAGTNWGDELARAIDQSRLVLFFASAHSVVSPHCLNEIAYATDSRKPVVPVYLDSVQVTGGLKLFISRMQAISRWQLSTDEYHQQLRSALLRPAPAPDAIPMMPPQSVSGWYVPIMRNRYFEGREDILDRVATALDNRPSVVALTGLAGVGKTQVALEYAFRHRSEYDLVAWVRAEEDSAIEADLVDLAGKLGLENAGDPNTAVVLSELRRHFEALPSWLLILDNAERPEMLSRYLPTDMHGHVIVTSRLQNWGHYADTVPVDAFPIDNAVGFMLQRLPAADVEAATRLVQTLGRLPLALEEAAAYIDATGRSISSYQELFEKHHRALFTQARPPDDYPQTFGTAMDVSLRHLESEDEDAAHMLRLLACVAPDDISIPLMFSAELNVEDGVPEEIAVDRCVSSMRKYSFIKVEEGTVSLHRLVQLVIRDRMSPEDFERYVTRGVELVESVFPRVRMMGPHAARCRRLMPHAIALCGHAKNVPAAQKSMALLLGRTGTFMSASGWDKEALNHLDRAYQVVRTLPEDPSLQAFTCELYAGSLLGHGMLEASLEKFVEAIEHYAKLDERKLHRELGIHAQVAWIQWCRGDFEAAQAAAEKSLDIATAAYGDKAPQRLGAMGILARVHLDCGRIPEARATIDETIAAIEQLGGFRLPLMCGIFMQIAYVLHALGRPQRAQSWAEEAIQVGKTALSEVHPLIATSRCVLGQIKLTLGEPEAALAELNSATVAITGTGYKLNQHMIVAACYLVRTLVELDDLAGAETVVVQHLDNLRDNTAGDIDFVEAMAALAKGLLIAVRDGDDRAEALCREGDHRVATRYGELHSYRLETLLGWADVQRILNQLDAAQATHELGLEIADHNGLDDHPFAASHQIGLASIEEARGDAESAARRRAIATDILSANVGPLSKRILKLQEA